MKSLTDMLNIKHPIIMAPMFLVTNKEMMISADKAGIAGCIPAHNFRTIKEFENVIDELSEKCEHSFGVNIITNRSNPLASKQIDAVVRSRTDFIITSLGSPEEVIKKAKEKDIKVFCDVIDHNYAMKVEKLGADALIAVNNSAGGHLGKWPASILIPYLIKQTNLPVISAGGVGDYKGLQSMLSLGAIGASIGSPFIATFESGVSKEYKEACVNYGAQDIVVSTKISGTPCTVINTPYVQKVGTEQNFIEAYLNKNKKIKKYAKMVTAYKGMKAIEKAAFSSTYKSVWCAGPSIQMTEKIESVTDVVQRIITP
ncbi:MAG: NAD(P)H-dependent flavin oxidoreductase [Bacteriovoracaceae bacterium]